LVLTRIPESFTLPDTVSLSATLINPCNNMFDNCNSITTIPVNFHLITTFNVNPPTNAYSYMFRNCTNLD
jgi:hypothetical protein